jgi:hypothetical protein
MPNQVISSLTVPVNVGGTITNTTFDLKDAYARQRISELGSALYWMGVTTTELTDGSETNPITIGGESVEANVGGMAQYDSIEFVWNGTEWQEIGRANFGALAFKNSAEGTYTPAGSVSVSEAADSTDTVTGVTAVGTLPSFSVSSETLTFDAGTLPTAGSEKTFVTASGARTATFSGTQATITVS